MKIYPAWLALALACFSVTSRAADLAPKTMYVRCGKLMTSAADPLKGTYNNCRELDCAAT
jgi:hypothetical protein